MLFSVSRMAVGVYARFGFIPVDRYRAAPLATTVAWSRAMDGLTTEMVPCESVLIPEVSRYLGTWSLRSSWCPADDNIIVPGGCDVNAHLR
jgi:hypothetical protein